MALPPSAPRAVSDRANGVTRVYPVELAHAPFAEHRARVTMTIDCMSDAPPAPDTADAATLTEIAVCVVASVAGEKSCAGSTSRKTITSKTSCALVIVLHESFRTAVNSAIPVMINDPPDVREEKVVELRSRTSSLSITS